MKTKEKFKDLKIHKINILFFGEKKNKQKENLDRNLNYFSQSSSVSI